MNIIGRGLYVKNVWREFRAEQVKNELAKSSITFKGASWKGIAEETYQTYKESDEVLRVSHEAAIGKFIARVVPVAVMKS